MPSTCRVCQRPSVTGVCYACAWYMPASREPSRDEDIPSDRHSENIYRMFGGMPPQTERDRAYQAVTDGRERLLDAVVNPPVMIETGDELRALVEVELMLSSWWHQRHSCGCPRCLERL